MKFTPRQIDLITNGMSGITGVLTLGLVMGAIDFEWALVLGFIAHTVTAFLTGKGVPTVKQVSEELKNQSNL